MRVLFVGQGALGWRTAFRAIKERRPPSGCSAQFFELAPSPLSQSSYKQLVPKSIRRAAKLRSRSLRYRLEAVLRDASQLDHLHVQGHLGVVPEVVARLGVPYSVTADATELQKVRDLSRYGWRHHPAIGFEKERQVFQGAAFICCTSNWAKSSVISDYGVEPDRVHVTPFPVIGQSALKHPSSSWLTFIGNDLRRKRLDRLLEWHQRYLWRRPELHIVSSDPAARAYSGLPDVVFHGELENEAIRLHVLPRTRLLVLPTIFDQSPIVLAEAAAAGVPAVASGIAGIPELVIDGATGLLADPRSDEQFIGALQTLLDDDQLTRTMSEKARRHYLDQLHADDSLDLLWSLIVQTGH